tara:strand:- start:21747 stop:23261 length:1515 start_codon:yes stop_codon:yes gene_type:complete
MQRSLLATCALCLALGACTVGPDYVRPEVAAPAAYANDPAPRPAAADAELAQWWQQFDDPVLDQLVEQALASNIDVQIASSRIAEARYRLAAAKASALPEVDATASANHTDLSENSGLSSLASALGGGQSGSGGGSSGGGSATASPGLPGQGFSTFSAGFDASWEPDIFGGARRASEAARANLAASEWSQRDTQVRLTAEVARTLFTLRELQAQQVLAQQLADVRSAEVDALRAKVAQDLVPDAELAQPLAQLSQAQAQVAQLQGSERAQRAALAVLLGTTVQNLPADLDGPQASAAPAAIAIPAGLPSELLQRRPDIRAAERNLAAATAQIGVARADRFPHISLTGVVDLISSALSSLVSSDSLQTVVQGQAAFPLLDFGRGAAKEGVAREQAQQAALSYRQSVLGAFADVEQSLATLAAQRANNQSLQDQLEQAQVAEAAAQTRFDTGLTDFLPLGQAREGVLAARQALAESDLSLRQAEIATFKALGGGWSETAQQSADTQ